MDPGAFEHHLTSPQGQGHHPPGAFTVTVGGGSCCDRIRFSVALEGDTVADAGFDAEGCGSATAAGSAAVELVRGGGLLAAGRIGPRQIAAELGGLSPGKLHAAELASDALARALGAAVSGRAPASGAPEAGGRTLVAMSSGVDSTVAALLSARTRSTVAVTLELWADPENDAERSCCSASAVAQARSLAHSIGLAHFTLDLRNEFRDGVVEPFIAAHAGGETPNPCVGCNGHVRLDAMLAFADRLGCDRLATGHYARIAGPAGGRSTGAETPLLRVAVDAAKDQSYMLAALTPGSLARMEFPLGELTKPEVRRLAAEAGLPVAAKADSQDLCFLAGTDRGRFLARHGGLHPRPGAIVDRAGAVLGRHGGVERFTVGQRRGLGVAGAEPLYVLDKDPTLGTVLVGPREALRIDEVPIRAVTLHRPGASVDRVKLRYRSAPVPARLPGDPAPGRHRSLTVALQDGFDGVAPGQLACLMAGELVVGHGTIERRRPSLSGP